MSKVTMLRTLVNNGWTIANRRAVVSQIGKNNFDELATLAKKANMGGDVFTYQSAVENLTPNTFKSTKSFLSDVAEVADEPSMDIRKWGRDLKVGKGNWNSQYYSEYRELCTTGWDIEIPGSLSPTDLKKHKIFSKCKPLGFDEVQYRGEVYSKNNPHYSYLTKLKKGDIYEPHSNLWTTDNMDYAYGHYGATTFPNYRAVHYEILCTPETRIIQTPYGHYGCSSFTEGILSPTARYRVLNNEVGKDGALKIRLEVMD